MVEANTELLGGAAVTVFLALLFFGVVVLWDVALALRSVGDKIDKLEDNIDDDLTDIAHHLDGMSNVRGGGGTQLHLSGGTISSGPGASQPQQAPPGQQQGGTQQPADQTPPGGMGPQPQSHPQQADQRSQAARREEEPTSNETTAAPESPRADEDRAETNEPIADDHGSDEPEPESDAESDIESDDEAVEHPRTERSRGRFITSPDRTAWYATPLDREAIAAAQPTIAGELTDGSDDGIDESDVIAAGPIGSSTTAETEADGVAADTVSGEETDETTDEVDAGDDDESVDDSTGNDEIDDVETGDDETGNDDAMGDAQATSAAASETTENGDHTPRESPDDGGEGDEGDADRAVDDDDGDPIAGEGDGELEGAADEPPESPDDIDVLSFDEPSEDADATRGDTEIASTDDESSDTEGTDHADVPDVADDSTEPVPADEESPLEEDAASDAEAAEATDPDAADAETAGALSPFEFDESKFEADEDVTVEDAVDTMNENAPAPELSSHRFDVTAEETDDGGAVVTLAFEPDTIEITGSTKRLLQYQLQSFADRESTPTADVTISRDRIVIELHDSEGSAIQQWGEAAVSIVDRTLYLSDNSPDS